MRLKILCRLFYNSKLKAKLSILVLHRLGDPDTWRQSMVEKELCLSKFAPDHNYLEHDFSLPLPEYVKDIAFDAIILTQTFLGARQDPVLIRRLESEYGEILRSNVFKIALPQDDYTCSAKLDRWLCQWNVDLVYPVCLTDWDVLYPNYIKIGCLKVGYTGYISKDLINRTELCKPIEEREIDVAYRAANLSPVFGLLGKIKTEYGKNFREAASNLSLRLDISTNPKDTILGTNWYGFIENSRCMLGVNSGSSLIDPEGEIDDKVFRYLQKKPKASFAEVEAHCFPKLDGKYSFSMISPRNIECSLFGTVQILTPGPYGNFIKPGEHYISLRPDMSNFDEVSELLKDLSYLESIAGRCRESILSYPELRYTTHVADLINQIKENTLVTDLQREKSIPLLNRYNKEILMIANKFWGRRRLTNGLRKKLGDIGFRRIKYWLKDKIKDNIDN